MVIRQILMLAVASLTRRGVILSAGAVPWVFVGFILCHAPKVGAK